MSLRTDGLTLRTSVVTALLTAGAMLLAQAPPAPTPQARFRARTDLVQVDVAVLDKKRRPVRGLTAADFTILEDGNPRPIQAFTEVNLPGRVPGQAATWDRDVPSDVVSNQAVDEEGRIVMILLDRTIPVGQPTIMAKRIAAAAVDQLGPWDLAAVVSTSGGSMQNLTSDRARLLRAINRSDVSTGSSSDVREIEEQLPGELGVSDALMSTWTPFNDGRCLCGLCVLDTVTRLADAVRDTPRRRKVLFFIGSDLILQSGGVATPGVPSGDIGCEVRLRDARTAMFLALDRSNLTVHSVDPSGLNVVGPIGRTSSPVTASRVAPTFARDTMDNLQHQDALRVLPDRTGGRTVVNSNAPNERVPEIFRESDSYYLLGFRPADPGVNPTLHKIAVKVNRRGLAVHSRSGYLTPSALGQPAPATASHDLPEALRAALSGLLPNAAAPLDVNVATFAVPGSGRGTVVLVVGLGDFAPVGGGGRPAGGAQPPGARERGADPSSNERGAPFELVSVALDRGGRSKATARQTLNLAWPTSDHGQPRVDILSRLDLAPGDYEIRVGATGADAARSASVFTYVTVPAFDTEPLSLSSIVIGALPATTTAPRDFLVSLLPIVPTAQRDFLSTDRLTGFVRIYQGTSRRDPLAPVTFRALLVDAKGQTVAGESVVLTEGQFAKGRTTDHFLTVPIANLPSGDYLLRIEAAIGGRVAGRAVRFRVSG